MFTLGSLHSTCPYYESWRCNSFDLVDLSIGENGVLKSPTINVWGLMLNSSSSAFCKSGFVDRLGLFMVSQISWTFCFMTFLDLAFSLTDQSISSI
ncbi:hypothetical protein STEG23_015725, partial [Scotinomys teguina]